ncbi:UPF0481 protein At3g47200 [Linum grandiflorum]
MTGHRHTPNPERRKEHVAIEIQPSDDNLVSSILRQMETVSSLHSICRVSPTLRASSKRSYVPDKVSIGPYHHGASSADESLKTMEDHKWRYIHALLNRKPDMEASLDGCVSALKELEQRCRACYESDVGLSSHEFVKVMFVDGCFIIELFLKYSNKTLRRRNDPIFSVPGMLFDLRCDLILLENQIPLFVLQRLFQLVPIPKQSMSLPELAFRFFRNMIPGDPVSNREKFNQEGNHLLDLICHCLLPTLPRLPHSKPHQNSRPASDLHTSGIKIQKSKTNNLLDIKFANGVLQIPPIQVHRYTESLFRNLIALERCSNVHQGNVHHVTSYVVLMGSLIRSEKDVKLLRQREILTSYYDDGGEKVVGEVGKLFEKLCEEVELNESYYDGLCEVVNGYRGKNIRALKKKLKQRHGNYKRRGRRGTLKWVWLVAVLVLLIALVGTLFSVLTFVHHKV